MPGRVVRLIRDQSLPARARDRVHDRVRTRSPRQSNLHILDARRELRARVCEAVESDRDHTEARRENRRGRCRRGRLIDPVRIRITESLTLRQRRRIRRTDRLGDLHNHSRRWRGSARHHRQRQMLIVGCRAARVFLARDDAPRGCTRDRVRERHQRAEAARRIRNHTQAVKLCARGSGLQCQPAQEFLGLGLRAGIQAQIERDRVAGRLLSVARLERDRCAGADRLVGTHDQRLIAEVRDIQFLGGVRLQGDLHA